MTPHQPRSAGDAEEGDGGTAVDAADLAAFLGADRSGPATVVTGVDSLDAAGPDDLAFCTAADPEAVDAAAAGVVVCPPAVGSMSDRALVHTDNPRDDFARLVDEFFRADREGTTVHPTATVEPGATVGEDCRIDAGAYVADCVTLGDRVTVGPGTALGGVGFGFGRGPDDELTRQVHQGTVVVADDVELGANCSVDRAVFDETRIGRGTKLSANVHLAHQVRLGADTTVAFGAGFAGGVAVGDRVTVHPNVSVATDVTVGDDAELGMNAAVLDDVADGATVVGSPAKPVDAEGDAGVDSGAGSGADLGEVPPR